MRDIDHGTARNSIRTDRLDIAVIIVSYRCARYTIESLRSLQTELSDSEVSIRAIVVDNASGDAPAIAQAILDNNWSAWVSLIVAPRNGGFGFGNNLGIDRAYAAGSPAYFYLLNPDAQIRPGAIDALVRFMERHPEVGIAGSSFENPDGSDWPIAFRFPTLLSEIDTGLQIGVVTRVLSRWVVARHMSKTPKMVDWVSGASMMLRPQLLSAVGGFDENYFLYFEETDLSRRARVMGFETWYVPQSRVMHIAGQSTQVTNPILGRKRLPSYWYESRRRYFVAAFGLRHAMAIDAVALLAHAIGWLKLIMMGQQHRVTPHFIRDLARHSVLRRRNREFPPIHCFVPGRKATTDPS